MRSARIVAKTSSHARRCSPPAGCRTSQLASTARPQQLTSECRRRRIAPATHQDIPSPLDVECGEAERLKRGHEVVEHGRSRVVRHCPSNVVQTALLTGSGFEGDALQRKIRRRVLVRRIQAGSSCLPRCCPYTRGGLNCPTVERPVQIKLFASFL